MSPADGCEFFIASRFASKKSPQKRALFDQTALLGLAASTNESQPGERETYQRR